MYSALLRAHGVDRVSNDLAEYCAQDTQQVRRAESSKIEEFERQVKQLRGIESLISIGQEEEASNTKNDLGFALLWSVEESSEEVGIPQWRYHLPNRGWFAR